MHNAMEREKENQPTRKGKTYGKQLTRKTFHFNDSIFPILDSQFIGANNMSKSRWVSDKMPLR